MSDFPCHLGAIVPSGALGRMNIVGLMLAQVAASAAVQQSAQNLLEHLPGNGDLGHLEGDAPAMADDLGADLDQLLLQARQRPVFDRLWRRQCAQEVAEIVGERMELQAHCVGGERPALQPRPLDRTLAFLDPLLGGAALVLEGDDALGRAAHVGDDEANARIKLAWMPLTLGNHPARLASASCLVGEPGR